MLLSSIVISVRAAEGPGHDLDVALCYQIRGSGDWEM